MLEYRNRTPDTTDPNGGNEGHIRKPDKPQATPIAIVVYPLVLLSHNFFRTIAVSV